MPDDTTTTTTDDTTELQDVATGGDTTTVDLQDLVADYREELERVQAQKEAYEDGDEDAVWPPEDWAEFEFPVRKIQHTIGILEAEIDRFGGSQFVITKARAGEAARATNMLVEDASKAEAAPEELLSMYEHYLVQVCVEKAPPEAPTSADGRLQTTAFEQESFRWLRNRIENFNTYGEVYLDDF